jgi:hypothetical protein
MFNSEHNIPILQIVSVVTYSDLIHGVGPAHSHVIEQVGGFSAIGSSLPWLQCGALQPHGFRRNCAKPSSGLVQL